MLRNSYSMTKRKGKQRTTEPTSLEKEVGTAEDENDSRERGSVAAPGRSPGAHYWPGEEPCPPPLCGVFG